MKKILSLGISLSLLSLLLCMSFMMSFMTQAAHADAGMNQMNHGMSEEQTVSKKTMDNEHCLSCKSKMVFANQWDNYLTPSLKTFIIFLTGIILGSLILVQRKIFESYSGLSTPKHFPPHDLFLLHHRATVMLN